MPLRSRPTLISAAAAALVVFVALPAHAQQINERIGDGIVRSFASASAQANAEASVAIVGNWPSLGAPPPGFGPLPTFSTPGGVQTVTVTVEPGTNLYATGSQSGPMERVGRRVEYYNLDNYAWGDWSNRNYQTHPWVLGVRADGSAFGVLFDSTWYSSLDTEHPLTDGIIFQTEGASPRVVTIDGASPEKVVKTLSNLTGRPFMPPMWSLGYHQSKYSYVPQSYALSVAQEFRNRLIPAEVLWLDIDYMDGFRNFSYNSSQFPNPGQLNTDLESIGFQGVWMANCGMKVDGGYAPYNDMVAGDLATKQSNGVTDYIAQVWPGDSVWPDFTMLATRDWWADEIKNFALVTIPGIDGVWNDMNEPAVFNVGSKTMPDDNWHRADADLGGPDIHRRYHNIYGMQMSKATRDGMLRAYPNKRPFVLTRAGYMGGHRYAAMWTGDNNANWYHVDVSIQNVLNIGLSGQPNCGPDIGGFNGDSGALMYARWMGIGALMPFARGHYGFSSSDREPWSYGSDCEDTCRLALNRRYRLLNYLYTQFYEAHQTGMPAVRPLFFAEPANPDLRFYDNGFLVGPGLLVVAATTFAGEPQVPPMQTPIYRLAFAQSNSPGAPLDTLDPDLPDLYVLGGHIVVANDVVQTSQDLTASRTEPIELIVALDDTGQATGTFYEDDGDGWGYQSGDYMLATFGAQRVGGDVTVSLDSVAGSYALLNRDLTIRVLLGGGAEATHTRDDERTPDHLRRPPRDARCAARPEHPRRSAHPRRVRPGEPAGDQRRAALVGDLAAARDVRQGGRRRHRDRARGRVGDRRHRAGAAHRRRHRRAEHPEHLGPQPAAGRPLGPDRHEARRGLPRRQHAVRQRPSTATCTATGSRSMRARTAARSISAGSSSVRATRISQAGPTPTASRWRSVRPGTPRVRDSRSSCRIARSARASAPEQEIKIFAMVVKSYGDVTPQTLPGTGVDWPGYAPDFTSMPGDQCASLLLNPPAGCVGDIDGDGATNSLDFAIFAPNYGTTGHPPFTNGDLDGDGDVDALDFAIFAPDYGCLP